MSQSAYFGNPTQRVPRGEKKKKPAQDCMGALGGAKTGKSTFQSMEHVSGKPALKYVTDAAQTY